MFFSSSECCVRKWRECSRFSLLCLLRDDCATKTKKRMGGRLLSSRRLGALCIHVDGVERLAGGHEKAVSLGAAETEVGTGFGKMNLADERAVGSEDVDAVVAFSS